MRLLQSYVKYKRANDEPGRERRFGVVAPIVVGVCWGGPLGHLSPRSASCVFKLKVQNVKVRLSILIALRDCELQ